MTNRRTPARNRVRLNWIPLSRGLGEWCRSSDWPTMEINPYSSPTVTTAIRETRGSALGVALRFSVAAYLGAIGSFALLGCIRWLALNAINSYRQSRAVAFADWWHENFLTLVDGPLCIASAVFVYFATNKLVKVILDFQS